MKPYKPFAHTVSDSSVEFINLSKDKLMLFEKPMLRPLSGMSQMSCDSSVTGVAQANQLLSEWMLCRSRVYIGVW